MAVPTDASGPATDESEDEQSLQALFEDEDDAEGWDLENLAGYGLQAEAVASEVKPGGAEGAALLAARAELPSTVSFSLARHGSPDEAATQLTAWATREGAMMDKVTVAPSQWGGLGVIATEAIDAGQVVMRIPRSLVVTHERCQDPDSPCGALLRALDVPPFTSMMVFLLSECERPESFYAPYLPTLPTPEELNNAPLMSNEEVAVLEATPFADKVQSVRKRVAAAESYFKSNLQERFPEAFPDGHGAAKDTLYSPHWLKWAAAVILSRAFEINGHMIILPLIDSFNHDPVKGGSLSWNATGEFEVRTGAAYEEGEEVYLSYGPPEKMGNDNLKATYGFTLP